MSDLKCFICVSFNGPFWGYFVPCGLFDPSVKANMSLKAKIINNGLLVISYFIRSTNISWPIRIEKESQLKKRKIYVKINSFEVKRTSSFSTSQDKWQKFFFFFDRRLVKNAPKSKDVFKTCTIQVLKTSLPKRVSFSHLKKQNDNKYVMSLLQKSSHLFLQQTKRNCLTSNLNK